MQSASKREACYTARDEYFACIAKEGVSSSKCSKPLELYEQICPGSWRNYFMQQRERETVLQLQADISRQKKGVE